MLKIYRLDDADIARILEGAQAKADYFEVADF